SPVERTGRRSHTGGAMEIDRAPPPVSDLPGPGAGRIAGPGTADPVDELREALGFGPLDRTALAPRPAWAGAMYESGARDSSPQLAFDVPIAWRSAVSTRGTALGAYVERAEEVIASRWRAHDLDAHSRALGLQGEVTVRYLVRPDGRTGEVAIVRSSGNPELDRMAVEAIPARLARFPRELGSSPFHHEITLRYRNPLVTP
ncbi:MAG: energy transducer TonB, partial [Myxococcota bacterium]